jgi:SET domain-containing protein
MISWISSKIEVRKSSTLGVGNFAKELIKKGEKVIVQGGRMISSSEFDSDEFKDFWYHAFQIEKDVYICPFDLKKETLDGIFNVNHSCDPTCGFNGQVTMVSMRDIFPDEQITFDYVMSDVGLEEEDWEDMKCLCGSKNCRVNITGNDWKDPNLQKKYKGYFSRYVQDIIDAN